FRQEDPYRELSRKQFDRTVEFLSEGISRSTGRSRVYLHHDRVGKRLRTRKGSRIAAACNAGAIPEIGLFRVVVEPEHTVVGTVDEDFALESLAGDVFLLGNTSWRIKHVRGGDVTVTDAQGAPPTIPFWRGEAPGRTIELSEEVSRLREELDQRIGEAGNSEPETRNEEPSQTAPDSKFLAPSSALNSLVKWLVTETCCSPFAAEQAADYAAAQKAAIGLLPTQRRIVFERFFDESGGMQMVIHAPFGSRINKAWGLAMRKRFCRSFDFELQATADDDGFILSLGPQHSFPLESMFPMLNENTVQPLLEQAVLAVPMFGLRWRWNVTRALLVLRMQNGKKVPPAFQRFRAEDLLTAVFPRITGCLEEHTGDIDIPDHPLVEQTMDDCLHEALDIDALKQIFSEIDRGTIQLIARDTREPSPFSYELLNANPYAFLDGGELQERRARAVSSRRSLTVESVDDLGRLDPNAIHQVQLEAQPLIRNADELHDALLSRILLPVNEAAEWFDWYHDLSEQQRAATITLSDGSKAWVAAERIPAAIAAFPSAASEITIAVPEGVEQEWTSVEARVAIVRGLIEISGPVTSEEIAARLSFTPGQCTAALEALEGEGVVLRGHFTPENHTGWSETNETETIETATTNAGEPAKEEGVPKQTHPSSLVTRHSSLTVSDSSCLRKSDPRASSRDICFNPSNCLNSR
ncbi:MAG: DEAD/DEAH box helicase, partial [Planctomycetes bacterium]|nr:DEAD/DEAH box helicase [Planctomycetota bacterium]